MIIKVHGFAWESKCGRFTINQFFESMNGYESNFGLPDRRLYLKKDNENFWLGLVLSIKDYKKFSKVISDGGTLTLDAHSLNQNEHIADFNFFVFYPHTGIGLYQSYHHSCSLNTFNSLCYRKFRDKILNLIAEKRKEMQEQNFNAREIKRELRNYAGNLETSIIENERTLEQKLQRAEELRNVTVNFKYAEDNIERTVFRPFNNTVKSLNINFSFFKESPLRQKVSTLLNYLSGFSQNGANEYKNVKIEAIEDSKKVIYKLLGEHHSYGEFDYETSIPTINLNDFENSIEQNEIIIKLKSILNDNGFNL